MTTTRRTEVNDLPPIEQNQFVSRKSPVLTQLSSKQPATQEAIVEDVCGAESLDIKSIEQQQMSKSVSECDLERKAKEAETIEDEVVGTDLTSEAQDESEYKKEVSNIDVVKMQ